MARVSSPVTMVPVTVTMMAPGIVVIVPRHQMQMVTVRDDLWSVIKVMAPRLVRAIGADEAMPIERSVGRRIERPITGVAATNVDAETTTGVDPKLCFGLIRIGGNHHPTYHRGGEEPFREGQHCGYSYFGKLGLEDGAESNSPASGRGPVPSEANDMPTQPARL